MGRHILTGKLDPIHPLLEDEAHECPACNSKTRRRIRRMPTFGIEDARCNKCVRTGKWPEQEEGVKYGDSAPHAAAKEVEGQASFGEGGGTE